MYTITITAIGWVTTFTNLYDVACFLRRAWSCSAYKRYWRLVGRTPLLGTFSPCTLSLIQKSPRTQVVFGNVHLSKRKYYKIPKPTFAAAGDKIKNIFKTSRHRMNSSAKMKILVCAGDSRIKADPYTLGSQRLERVNELVYLRRKITWWRRECVQEIKRARLTKASFN